MKFVNKTIKLLCLMLVVIGTFSLSNFAYSKPQCEINEYSLLSYLVNSDKVCGKFFSRSDIVSVIKVLDAYWDWNTTNEERFKLFSEDYGNRMKKRHGWKGEPEYSMPSTEYERIWHGYRIIKIQSYIPRVSYIEKALEITINMKWSKEAYHGTMTYIFHMANIDDTWVIVSFPVN